ncbi:MAG: hypothetical protein JRF63_02590 [Deltaproteobacteria bacterium]|nr:hypothetical protein [Deltaproteobacteria bacterium]
MKKCHKDRLADALVDELPGKISDRDEALASEIERELEDRDDVYWSLAHENPRDVETGIESAQALIDRLDLSEYEDEDSFELEQRVQHARAVLANTFLALYGGFGDRPAIEA